MEMIGRFARLQWIAVRQAVRSLLRDRSQVAGMVLTLALGIGLMTAIGGIADAVFFRDLPFGDGDRLVMIANRYGHGTEAQATASSPPDYKDRVDYERTLDSLAAWRPTEINVTGRGEPVRLLAGRTTASMQDTLGVRPLYGRWFTEAEDSSRERVIVLSFARAVALFGEPENAVGGELVVNGTAATVIGVMGPRFDFAPRGADLWIPLGLSPAELSNENRGNEYLYVVGRMSPDSSIEQVRADMQSIAEGVATRDPSRADYLNKAGWGATVISLREELYGDLGGTSKVLVTFGLVVLLLSLTNAAQLAVVRSVRRRDSLAIREAVGASRLDLVRQLVAESVVVGVVAASLAIGVAGAVFRLVTRFAPIESLRDLPLSLDVRIVVLAATCAIGCGLVASIGPLVATRGALAGVLGAGRSGVQSRGVSRLRAFVMMTEVALSVTLITGGIVVWRQVDSLLALEPGFNAAGVTTMRMSLPSSAYDAEGRLEFQRRLLARLQEDPAIESVALATSLPMSGEEWTASFDIDGRPELRTAGGNIRIVSPSYFDLMSIPFVNGVTFGAEGDEALEVIVDEEAVRKFWPGTNPVGTRITFSDRDADPIVWWRIAGVVGSIRDRNLEGAPEPHVYFPASVRPPGSFFVAARAAVGVREAETRFRSVVREIDPSLPVSDVISMDGYLTRSVALHSFRSTILWALGVAGLVLAALGVYGVVAFAFALAKADHAVRLALGATRGDLVSLGLRWALLPLIPGAIAGCVASFALATLTTGSIPVSTSALAIAAGGACMAVAVVVVIAALVPAVRLSNIDPVDTLRAT